MFSNTVALTISTATTYQRVAFLDTSAKQRITLYANDQDSNLDLSRIFAQTAFSLEMPGHRFSGAYLTMLASENILRRDWDQPEEDKAWENL